MTTKTTKSPRRAKTTKTSAKETATKTSTTKKVAQKKDTTSANKLKSLEEKLNKTEARLNTLINILHTEMKNHLERGPEGLASKLRKNDLLE